MEELQVIETTSGRQFKPWASREDVQAIGQAVEQAVQDPESVTGLVNEIASGKQAIASAINAKGGSASATESFTELAQDIQDTPTSGVLSSGIVQSEPFSFLDYVCKKGAYPFTEIDDNSVTIIDRESGFSELINLLKVKMTALRTISGGRAFANCSALQVVDMPNLATISGSSVFQNCLALQVVDMPSLATISGSSVFQNCSALQVVDMPNLMTISVMAVFRECYALQHVNLPTLATIVQDTFYRCDSINILDLPSLIKVTGTGCFGITPLKSLTVGTLQIWNNDPFYINMLNLRNLEIGQNTNINLDFRRWTATNVIAEGQSGIDELNLNLQTNLISKLYQGGGKILRLGATLYDVTTQETRDMVTAKGWTLQRG